MSAKEKADELFWKYRPIIAGKQFVTGLVLMSEAKELTKQCALIAVDEMLDFRNGLYINEGSLAHKYLLDIKHEIEKL
jgi:hypothetical protein